MKKQISGMIGLYAVGVIVAFLLIVVVFALPTAPIKNHVAESVDTILNEGTYPAFMEDKLVRMHPNNAFDLGTLLLNNRITARDNFTDALMLLQASYDGTESVLERSMAVYRYADANDSPLSSLDVYVKGEINELQRMPYDRYWHGYMVFLRPLLLFLNLKQIRILNLIIMVVLLLWICKLMSENVLRNYRVWFLYGLLFFMPFTIPFCMQFCTSTYVMLIALIILLKNYEWLQQGARMAYYFMIVGMTVVYVDYLTFPLVTFGIPVIVLMLMDTSEDTLWKKLVRVIRYGIDWSIGYVGLWMAKWVIAFVVLHRNVIKEGIEQVMFRSSSIPDAGDFKITMLKAWGSNVCNYVNIVYVIIIVIGLVWVCHKIHPSKCSLMEMFRTEGIYLLIATTPFVWYGIFKNHSYSHGSFTFRSLFITVFAGMVFLRKWRERCEQR